MKCNDINNGHLPLYWGGGGKKDENEDEKKDEKKDENEKMRMKR